MQIEISNPHTRSRKDQLKATEAAVLGLDGLWGTEGLWLPQPVF